MRVIREWERRHENEFRWPVCLRLTREGLYIWIPSLLSYRISGPESLT